jgi:hypothetical protein
MKLEIAEMIVDQLQNMGIEAELRDDYSGRGMFGKITAGIVTDGKNGPMIGFALALAISDQSGEEALHDFDASRELPRNIDSMGLSTIFY